MQGTLSSGGKIISVFAVSLHALDITLRPEIGSDRWKREKRFGTTTWPYCNRRYIQPIIRKKSLMNNHAHILLRSSEIGLSGFMRRFLTGYAVSYNQSMLGVHRRIKSGKPAKGG